ncbi:MAG: aminotransferase class V-fold PLP-dependent enzyme [Ornithinimicrobium sp.]
MSEPSRFDAAAILSRLAAYRAHDAATHGGRVLSYVYDSGLPELDSLAADAARMVQPVNGLDPTTFPSVAMMEGDLVAFGRRMLNGPQATGSITSGGTESCLLAVKAARDVWREHHPQAPGRPKVVITSATHAAFRKAAHYCGLDVQVVPVSPGTGQPSVAAMIEALDHTVALVVVSAPSYPHGVIEPVEAVAAAAQERGIGCHVDACIGGWILPWWTVAGGGSVPAWDFRVPGVTSISADLHKYGYAPKGASLLLFADAAMDRARYFALTEWLGYPVVNPTVLGSRSATSLAAAWSIVQALGESGYAERATQVVQATDAVLAAVAAIDGLSVHGRPVGPLIAVCSDPDASPEQAVDPHQWAAAVAQRGFILQGQPGLVQSDGTVIARTTHLTITPATLGVLDELIAALRAGAEDVREAFMPAHTVAGTGAPDAADSAGGADSAGAADSAGGAGNTQTPANGIPDPAELANLARETGEIDLASVLTLIEVLPREQSAQLLTSFLAEFTAPRAH